MSAFVWLCVCMLVSFCLIYSTWKKPEHHCLSGDLIERGEDLVELLHSASLASYLWCAIVLSVRCEPSPVYLRLRYTTVFCTYFSDLQLDGSLTSCDRAIMTVSDDKLTCK